MKHLCQDGETIVPRRIRAMTERDHGRAWRARGDARHRNEGPWTKSADTVIGIGSRPFEFAADTVEIVAVRPAFVALQEARRVRDERMRPSNQVGVVACGSRLTASCPVLRHLSLSAIALPPSLER
jgi:hypothetical protein